MEVSDCEVTFASGAVSLAGTLTQPEGQAEAVVVFAHGSGPLDRDENMPGLTLNIFSALAKRFAANGIASLRYDKRGVGESSGVYDLASQADLIADLGAAVAFARVRVHAPLILCGHSEGTSLAAALAAQSGARGLVLICPYLATGRDVLRQQAWDVETQVRAMPGLAGWWMRRKLDLLGWPIAQQHRLMEAVERSSEPTVRLRGQKIPAAWLRDFICSDQRARHSAHGLPCLALAAEFDAQCPPEDAQAIAALGPNRDAVVLLGLSHILRPTHGRDLTDYARQASAPIDDSVADAVLLWLRQLLGLLPNAHSAAGKD